MKYRITHLGLIVSAVCIVLVATAASGQSIFDPRIPSESPRSFVGTWIVQTQITNCAGVPLENFNKLVSINSGGTMQEVSSSTLFRSTALGIWEHVFFRDFVYAQRFFRFNPDGTTAGSVRAKWNITLNAFADTYTGHATVQVVLPNGFVVAHLCGTETGTRMTIPE